MSLNASSKWNQCCHNSWKVHVFFILLTWFLVCLKFFQSVSRSYFKAKLHKRSRFLIVLLNSESNHVSIEIESACFNNFNSVSCKNWVNKCSSGIRDSRWFRYSIGEIVNWQNVAYFVCVWNIWKINVDIAYNDDFIGYFITLSNYHEKFFQNVVFVWGGR